MPIERDWNYKMNNETIKYYIMEIIKNKEFGGERPLFATHDLQLENVTIHTGESALKECSNIIAVNCRFEGKYPFWHTNGFIVKNCLFTEGARADLWYSQHLQMTDTVVEAPKMFREMDGIRLENVQLPNALETLWHCRNVALKNVQIDKADYLFMHSEDIRIENYSQNGNYSFQYCKNVEIRNAVINSKDAFWNTENVTVYDSVIKIFCSVLSKIVEKIKVEISCLCSLQRCFKLCKSFISCLAVDPGCHLGG